MDYCEALEYLYSHIDFERDRFVQEKWHDLFPLKTLLYNLGDPQDYILRVNIVGTNGKGSTGAILSSIMRSAGYKVGFFSSPHLRSIRERIQIDGKPISKEDFTLCINDLKYAINSSGIISDYNNGRYNFRTVFEILTALAFYYFQRQNVDIAIMEAGLGGRFDATNVGRPDVLCITSISYDHCHILGRNIIDIAREKASVIKDNQFVSSAPQTFEVFDVIKDITRRRHAVLKIVGKDIELKINNISLNGTEFTIDNKQYRTPLIGYHQSINSALAVLTTQLLNYININTNESSIKLGLESAKWPGRMMCIKDNPTIILDGAHNPDGAKNLVRTIRDLYNNCEPTVIVGINENKDIPAILLSISNITDRVIFTSSNHPQAKDPIYLSKIFSRFCKNDNIKTTKNVKEALEIALAQTDGEPIIITGSLYLIGNVLDILDIEIYEQ
ncbi:MAG: bifunctional folylpolyglutamate synthase/dihydrofolate synthase [bacterium]